MQKRYFTLQILLLSSQLLPATTTEQQAVLAREATAAKLPDEKPVQESTISLDDDALPEERAAAILFNRLVHRGGAYDETLTRLSRLTKVFLFKKDLSTQPDSELFDLAHALLSEAVERSRYLYKTLDQSYQALRQPYFRILPDVQGPPLLSHSSQALRGIIALSIGMETVVKKLEDQLPGRDWLPWKDKKIKDNIYERLAQINTENSRLHGAAKEAHREALSLYAILRRGKELIEKETVVRREASRVAGWGVFSWFLPRGMQGEGSSRTVRAFAKEVGPLPKMPTFPKEAKHKPVASTSRIGSLVALGALTSTAVLAASYLRVRSLTHALLSKGQWSSWKRKTSLPDLIATPEHELQGELFKLINRKYSEAYKDGDVFMPLFAFIDAADLECDQLLNYQWWHVVLSAAGMHNLFGMSAAIIRDTESRLERLEFLRALVVSWIMQAEVEPV